MKTKITDRQFRVLLDLFMCSDPFPLSEREYIVIEDFLNDQAFIRGFDKWVGAYHALKV